jgi:hypothetical protein
MEKEQDPDEKSEGLCRNMLDIQGKSVGEFWIKKPRWGIQRMNMKRM